MMESVLVRGGWVMLPILALSIYALAIIFYKLTQFVRAGLFQQSFVAPSLARIKRGELRSAQTALNEQKSPIAKVMATAIACLTDRSMSAKSREAEISRVGTAELRGLETHMRGLEMVYTTAPLVGLLGTVIGMVTAFSTLASAGARVDPSILAGGIWQALITTVGGLCVAIPAVAAYYFLDSVIERVRATMRDATVQILALDDLIRRNELPSESSKLAQQSLFEAAAPAQAPLPEIPDTVASHIMVEKIVEHPAPEPLELSTQQIIDEPAIAQTMEDELVEEAPVFVQEAQPAPQAAPAPVAAQPAAAEPAKKRKPKKQRAPQPAMHQPAPQRAALREEPDMASAAHAVASNARLKLLSPTYNKL